MIEYLETELCQSHVLAVAFTGISHGLGGIHFEFGRSLGKIRCATLLVRDIGLRWYQYGPDDPSAAGAVVARIRYTAKRAGAKRIVCIGNSMGGFGALLYGSLLQADAVIAFCPQTAIDPAITSAMGDRRWSNYQTNIPDYPYGDISRLPQPRNVTVCYGSNDSLDVAHVDRLKWAVKRIVMPSGHGAVRELKNQGKLIPLLSDVVFG
jgi:pimeloyl-ACP methyl ester carboxylesterase